MQYIEVNNLSFSYESAATGKYTEILKDISFSIGENETIGIIGANGAGKSTLLKLLVGLQLSYKGNILIGGIPVRKETLKQIREKTGYVFQDSESQLFM